MTLDMRTLYTSYEEALKVLLDPANQTELLNTLQIIQEAAILDEVSGSEEEPLCTNINSAYNRKGQDKSPETVQRDLSDLLSNIAHHDLQWLQLEPNKGKVKDFLIIATRFAKELLQSMIRKQRDLAQERTKTKQITRLPTLPNVPSKKSAPGAQVIRRPKKNEDRTNTIDSLLEFLGFGKRDED